MSIQVPQSCPSMALRLTFNCEKGVFRGLMDMVDGEKLVPFARLFYDSPSTCIWEDEVGDVRHVCQGEGGEQGDPLMPLSFSLGQHRDGGSSTFAP